jgi:predicted O-methyltransferase YrrM
LNCSKLARDRCGNAFAGGVDADQFPFMSLASNLQARLQLISTALTRRYIWHDLTTMVKAQGFEFRGIRANTHPLRFARHLTATAPLPAPPDFSGHMGSAADFLLANTYPWNSEPSVSEFLGELAVVQGAHTIVELGCYVGWTSAHFALAQLRLGTGSRLWCVDGNSEFLAAARANLTRLGLAGQTEFVHGFSLDPAVFASLPASIDLLFIDTSHEYAPRLAPGGLIALHDSISQNGVRRAVFDLWDEFETLTFATELGNGVTVLRSRRSPISPSVEPAS